MASYMSWDRKKEDPFWFLNDAETPEEQTKTPPPVKQPEVPTSPPVKQPAKAPTPPPIEQPTDSTTKPPVMRPVVTPNKPSPGKLYAVIIGIDTYDLNTSGFGPLSGCAADADDVEQLCISTFGVPKDRIKNIRDKQATRSNIISAIEDLATNAAIQKNDPILIFYAGHGGRADPPDGWKANEEVSMIIPCNFVKKSTQDSPIETQGVLDVELAQLLNGVATKKSNNITVIMDCCHSGSGTRGQGDVRIRGGRLPKDYVISQALVNKVSPISTNTRGSAVAKGFNRKGLASHVLLAACKETELAREGLVKDRGAFTVALTKLLRDQASEKLTYTEIILRLPMIQDASGTIVQSPQVEGVHQYRALFDDRIPPIKSQIFGMTKDKGTYILHASEADGIELGCTFAVYPTRNIKGEPHGYIKTSDFENGKTNCKRKAGSKKIDMPNSGIAFVIQVDSGSSFRARLFLDLNDEHKAIFEKAQIEMQTNFANGRQVEFASSPDDDPELIVTAEGGNAVFEITDKKCRENGLTHIYYKDTPITYDNILRVLRAIADFFFHLRRSSKETLYQLLANNINIKCHELVPNNVLVAGRLTVAYNPAKEETSFIDAGELRVVASEKTKYGFSITSDIEDTGLYAAMFYFDMSDLSIQSYYLPILAQGMGDERVRSIPPKGQGKALRVGYGEGGIRPRVFNVKERQEIDVGYLRLFVSTDYADWTRIEQLTPFGATRGSTPGKSELAVHGWSAITIPVIAFRGSNEDSAEENSEEE